jgi:transposase
MTRKFKTPNYEETLELKISLRTVLPPEHLARFIVDVVAQLDLSRIYQKYGALGAPPYAPELLLGLLFYGYATGVFSSRKLEKATHEGLPFRFIAGNMRRQFLTELEELFVQILLIGQEMGHLQLGNVSLDGSKIHADASKSKAVSYQRLVALEAYLQAEVTELFSLAEAADGGQLPEELNVPDEVERRRQQLARLAEAKKVLIARAEARYAAEQADYEAKMEARAEKAAQSGRKPAGQPPQPPVPGVRDKDQYNFTDPESRIMKNANNRGFDQHYNTQVAVDHQSRLIVGTWVCDHPNDQPAALPTIDRISPALGKPKAVNLDTGYFSQANINGLQEREIIPYIATGRSAHHPGWRAYFLDHPEPPPAKASVKQQMAYQLRTESGKAVYRLRKSTVEPVIGIIKEVLNFRQFSLRGLAAVGGEWTLVCLAYNLKRLHTLQLA